jgi:hypothetical protein
MKLYLVKQCNGRGSTNQKGQNNLMNTNNNNMMNNNGGTLESKKT